MKVNNKTLFMSIMLVMVLLTIATTVTVSAEPHEREEPEKTKVIIIKGFGVLGDLIPSKYGGYDTITLPTGVDVEEPHYWIIIIVPKHRLIIAIDPIRDQPGLP